MLALTNQLSPIVVGLDQLFLDPNNPRFVDASWEMISDDHIADEEVQDRSMQNMVENHAVDKLVMNMEVNGFLPIDRVIVREFADGRYVVLEGNRRICSAKMISTYRTDGTRVSADVATSLERIPVLQYTGGDMNAAWIFQGLRHISGIEDWSAFNKAKLLVEQMEEEELSLTDAGKRFGLTAFGAGQWVRGYYAFKQAREASEYVAEVDERSYPYFQELFSRSSAQVRDWMQWNEGERKFENVINFNEFVSWLYPRPAGEDGNDSRKGDWERRRIARRDDIRNISLLLRDDIELFQEFRHTGDLEQVYAKALTRKYEREAREKADPVKDTFELIRLCAKSLENLPLRVIRDPALKQELDQLVIALRSQIEYVTSV